MRRSVAVASLLLCVLLVTGSAQAKPLPPADRAFVDEMVAKEMEAGRLPGFSISIAGPRGNYVRTYGVSNLGSRRPMALDDHVRIASITKTFTATAVLLQVQKGKLKLTERLSKYLKGVPNGERITIHQLLAMRSGLYDYTEDQKWAAEFEAKPRMRFDVEDVLAIVRRHKPLFAPGARTSYADTNYYFLGAILEQITGKSVARVVTEEVIEPLGLKHTSYPESARLPSPFARGYYAGADGEGPIRDYTLVNPDNAGAAGAMISTLGDLRAYARKLAKGALLSPKLQRARLRFGTLATGPEIHAGYGLGISNFGSWIGHNGGILGFSTVAFFHPGNGTTVAAAANLASNFSTPTLEVFLEIANRFYPGSLKGRG